MKLKKEDFEVTDAVVREAKRYVVWFRGLSGVAYPVDRDGGVVHEPEPMGAEEADRAMSRFMCECADCTVRALDRNEASLWKEEA